MSLPGTRGMNTNWRVQQRKGHQCGQGLEQMTFKGDAELDGLVWPAGEKAQAWGDDVEGGCREERDRFFSEVHTEKSRGSNRKLQQGIPYWAKGRNSSCEHGPALERAVHGDSRDLQSSELQNSLGNSVLENAYYF